MSGKSNKIHPSSRFSRVKQHVSSFFSRSSRSRLAASPAYSHLPRDNTGHVDAPSPHADTRLAPAPVSHRAPPSSVSAPSIANPLPVQPPSTERPTHHLEHSPTPNSSSPHVMPSLGPRLLQGQLHAPGAFREARDFTMNHTVFNDHST